MNEQMKEILFLLDSSWNRMDGGRYISPGKHYMFWKPSSASISPANEIRFYQFNTHLNDYFIVRVFNTEIHDDQFRVREIIRKEVGV